VHENRTFPGWRNDKPRPLRSVSRPGLGYALAILGMSFGKAASQAKTETPTNLVCVRGLARARIVRQAAGLEEPEP
jgi:hypothetical protein